MRVSEIKEKLKESIDETAIDLACIYGGIIAGGCLRDIASGQPVKDFDFFFVSRDDWDGFCLKMSVEFEEIKFEGRTSEKVNVRKFRCGDCEVDSIFYLHVQRPEHVVETFDFTVNMLWYDPNKDEIMGSAGYSVAEILEHIFSKRLIVGENLWYKASPGRALVRWKKFRDLGYTADGANRNKYSEYVKMLCSFWGDRITKKGEISK